MNAKAKRLIEKMEAIEQQLLKKLPKVTYPESPTFKSDREFLEALCNGDIILRTEIERKRNEHKRDVYCIYVNNYVRTADAKKEEAYTRRKDLEAALEKARQSIREEIIDTTTFGSNFDLETTLNNISRRLQDVIQANK
jgi:hypothetical protein